MDCISLFSGCGGMDLGFEGGFLAHEKSVNPYIHPSWIKEKKGQTVRLAPTGFDTVFANDIRTAAMTAWLSYFKKEVYHLESIVDLVKKEQSGIKIFPRNADVVIGGFPCQDFSIAGKRMGFRSMTSHDGVRISPDSPSEENRGKLYIWMKCVIDIVKPLMFVAENVKGLVSLEDAKSVIEHDFAMSGGKGYIVVPAKVLHAADYGVPQSRERVIFFGFRKDHLKPKALEALSLPQIPREYDPYPPKTHSYTANGEGMMSPVVCKDVFSDLPEPEFSDDPSQKIYSKAKYMGRHCQGQTEIRLDSIAPTIRSEHHGNIEFRRLSAEHGGKHCEELKSGLLERRLTVRECAKIQTFPDDYQFIIKGQLSSSDAYKLIGNAVPPMLAYNIAMNLAEKWNDYFN